MPHTSTPGKLRVHMETIPGTGAWATLSSKLHQRHDATHDADMVGEIVLAYAGEAQAMQLDPFRHLHQQDLLKPDALARILAYKPVLVVIPSLSAPDLDEVEHTRFTEAIVHILEHNIAIKTTFALVAYEGVNDMLDPPVDWPVHARRGGSFMRQHVGDFVVHDMPPQQLLEKHLRGELDWPASLASQRAAAMKISNLHRLREAMFQVASAHATDTASHVNPGLRDITPANRQQELWHFNPRQTAIGLLGVLGTTLAAFLLWDGGLLALSAATLLMLGSVVMVALNTNLTATLISSIVSLMTYKYLFIPPFHTLWIESWSNTATFAIYAAVCLATALLANASHFGETTMKFQASHTRALLRMVYDITYTDTLTDLIRAALNTLQRSLGLKAVFVITDQEPWQTYPDFTLSEMDTASIRKTLSKNIIFPTVPGQSYVWCPLQSSNQTLIGVLGVQLSDGHHPAMASLPSVVFLRTFGTLIGSAIRRIRLKNDQAQAGLQANRESLRASLLASVSHDLKTPLVSIIGSLSTLEFVHDGLPAKERQELLNAARTEAERLHRIVHNVLEMAKLESGAIIPRKEPVDLLELANSTAKRVEKARPNLKVRMQAPKAPRLSPSGDELLLSQVIYNLLDNAAKYGNPSKPITCSVAENSNNGTVSLHVTDSGPGIMAEERERIFDKFFRSSQTDHRQAGSGLGLAICRAIARAHGGDITVSDRTDGQSGSDFALVLPALPVLAKQGSSLNPTEMKEI